MSPAELSRITSGTATKGYFLPNDSYDDPGPQVAFLTLTFDPEIYISDNLDAETAKAVLAHEKVHDKDCKELADKVGKAVAAALKAGRDPEIVARMKWFHFDRCEKSKAFHAKVGYDIDICSEPSDPRPSGPRPK